jgi:phosphatidylglycerol:prolipoprotein diacylglycerol transferase
MLSLYQHLPEKISPIVFSVGFFSVRWYALMYLTAFLVIYALLRWRTARDISSLEFPISNFQFPSKSQVPISKSQFQSLILDFISYAIAGLLIGGRAGYVLFYNFGYYIQNPITIISPYDFSTGVWTGIYGMSYFGGVIGIVIASFIFTKKNKINFWAWSDLVIPAIPAGYFFGRIGNFLNGELYGRITEKSWGMYFPADFGSVLRHPSQLYEAFFEGLVLFLIVWSWRNKLKFSGQGLVIYLLGYGLFRFGIEFFRAPDEGTVLLFGILTPGQAFSLGFVALAVILQGALSKSQKVI